MRCVRSRGQRRLALSLLCASLLASGSCGEDDAAGRLTGVLSSEALLDGEPAHGGDRIPFGAVVTTNPSGVAEFSLGAGRLACRLRQSSEVHVGEAADAPVVFVVGNFMCRSEVADEDRPRLEAAGKIVEVGRANVNVEVTEAVAVVRNTEGDVTVDDVPLDAGDEIPIDQSTGELGPTAPIAPGIIPDDAQEVFESLDASLSTSDGTDTDPPAEEQNDDSTDPSETEPSTEGQDEPTSDPAEESSEVETDGTDPSGE